MIKDIQTTRMTRQWLTYVMLAVALLLAHNAYGQMHVFYREIVADANLPMVMRYFKEPQKKALTLFRKGQIFNGAIDPETQLLAKYYSLMVAKKYQAIEHLYYQQDGSRQRYIQKLNELPSRYDGYSNLTHVKVMDRYGWGPFKIISVQLLGKSKRNMKWREAIICLKKLCQLSNAIEQQDDKFNLYGIYALQKKSSISQSKLAKAFDKGRPVLWLPVNADIYKGLKQYPVSVVVSIHEQKKQILSLDETGSNKINISGYDIAPMLQFIKSVKNLGKEVEMLAPDKIDKEKIATKLGKILESYVVKSSRGFEFNLVSQFESEPEVKVEWYDPIAALQRISNWKNLTILGFMTIEDGGGVVVYFQPERESGDKLLVEPVQLFILRKNAKDQWFVTLEAKNSKISYLYNNQIVNSIQSQHGKEVSFIYKDPEKPKS